MDRKVNLISESVIPQLGTQIKIDALGFSFFKKDVSPRFAFGNYAFILFDVKCEQSVLNTRWAVLLEKSGDEWVATQNLFKDNIFHHRMLTFIQRNLKHKDFVLARGYASLSAGEYLKRVEKGIEIARKITSLEQPQITNAIEKIERVKAYLTDELNQV